MRVITREEAATFLSYVVENMAGLLSDSAIASFEQISENIENKQAGDDTWGAEDITREEAVTFLSYVVENMSGLLSDSAIECFEQISENIQNERSGYNTWGAEEEELHILYSETDDPDILEEKESLKRKYAINQLD